LLGTFALAALSATAIAAHGADAPRHPVTDTYWDIHVVDDYRYLESEGDAEAATWVDGEAARTRAWLDDWPMREVLSQRVVSLTHSDTPEYFGMTYRGGQLYGLKEQPPSEQPFLVRVSLRNPNEERVLVDPNAIDPGGNTSIDFYVPSHRGTLVAVSLSKNGTEDGTLYVYDTDTGAELPDRIPRVNGGTAGGSVAWLHDDSGFYYTRYPYPGERPDSELAFHQTIWFHRLGDPASRDHHVLGETFPRIAEIELSTSDDGAHVLASVSDGDGGEYEYWLLGPEGHWVRFAEFRDWVTQAVFGRDRALYLVSRKDAPRFRILRMPLDEPSLSAARVVVPEGEATIVGIAVTQSRLYLQEMLGGPTRIRAVDLDGRATGTIDTPEVSRVSRLTALDGDRLLFRRESFFEPEAWYVVEPGRAPVPTVLVSTSPATFEKCEARREVATADDGVQIPISILRHRDTPLDGTAPCILYAYGSYGDGSEPNFDPTRQVWLEQGGIYVVANVRGGGEFGDAWHRAANLERKKRSMDDLAACARYLVDRHYTSPSRLALEGGSAGGLLVYGTMAHYPTLMGAVVSYVGIGDALRTELEPNGQFNVTEFGSVRNETQFKGIMGYSPYHHLKNGTTYPAVLSTTGLNDPRVAPWQSFKMTARLLATGSPNPVLLRVSTDTGHGGSSSLSDRDAETVDVYGFLFKHFGIEYRVTERRAD